MRQNAGKNEDKGGIKEEGQGAAVQKAARLSACTKRTTVGDHNDGSPAAHNVCCTQNVLFLLLRNLSGRNGMNDEDEREETTSMLEKTRRKFQC